MKQEKYSKRILLGYWYKLIFKIVKTSLSMTLLNNLKRLENNIIYVENYFYLKQNLIFNLYNYRKNNIII